jgi:hypothetical protein
MTGRLHTVRCRPGEIAPERESERENSIHVEYGCENKTFKRKPEI